MHGQTTYAGEDYSRYWQAPAIPGPRAAPLLSENRYASGRPIVTGGHQFPRLEVGRIARERDDQHQRLRVKGLVEIGARWPGGTGRMGMDDRSQRPSVAVDISNRGNKFERVKL